MDPKEEIALKRAFSDIYRGYSVDLWQGERVYFKHLNQFDRVEIDIEYDRYFERVRKKGVPTKEEKLKTLHEQNLWTQDDESKLKAQKSFLDQLKKTKSKMPYEAQIKQISNQISSLETKYWEEYNKKYHFLGVTCESCADQNIQSFCIYNGLYRDASFTEKFWKLEEFNELEVEDLDVLTTFYIKNSNAFSDKNLKHISISSFFTSFFYLSEEIGDFFKKSLFELTYNQVNLVNYGNYYKSLLCNHDIPQDIRNDPDKIEEHVTKLRNMKDVTNRATGQGNTVLAGASKEDGKSVGATSYYAELERLGEISDINDAYKKMRQ